MRRYPRISIILLLILLAGCASVQEKWDALTPNEQARVIVNGFQKTLSSLFDTGKAYVNLHPDKQALWKDKAIPAFDAANQAIFVGIQACIEGKGIPAKMYDSIGPMMKAVKDVLLLIGVSETQIKA
jgi:hypothetical protein